MTALGLCSLPNETWLYVSSLKDSLSGSAEGWAIISWLFFIRRRERPMERDVIREEDRCVGEEIDWLLSECAADS